MSCARLRLTLNERTFALMQSSSALTVAKVGRARLLVKAPNPTTCTSWGALLEFLEVAAVRLLLEQGLTGWVPGF